VGTQIFSKSTPRGWEFRLTERGMFGRTAIHPVAQWGMAAPPRLLMGVSKLQAWVDDETATAVPETVLVPHAVVAGLDGVDAMALQLPPASPYILDLEHEGTLDQQEFRFRIAWRQVNGQPVPGSRREGSCLMVGSKHYRVPEPLFSILEEIDVFNLTPPSDLEGRFRAWGRLQPLLPEPAQHTVRVGSYLRNTRIAHAACFSLALSSGADGFHIEPILFGLRDKPGRSHVTEPTPEEEPSDSPTEAQALLPPHQQQLFARRRFPESNELRRAMRLRMVGMSSSMRRFGRRSQWCELPSDRMPRLVEHSHAILRHFPLRLSRDKCLRTRYRRFLLRLQSTHSELATWGCGSPRCCLG
jgi:hypothetical protein